MARIRNRSASPLHHKACRELPAIDEHSTKSRCSPDTSSSLVQAAWPRQLAGQASHAATSKAPCGLLSSNHKWLEASAAASSRNLRHQCGGVDETLVLRQLQDAARTPKLLSLGCGPKAARRNQTGHHSYRLQNKERRRQIRTHKRNRNPS